MSEIYSPGSIAGPPVTFTGPYNTATTYSIGQAVSSAGSSFISLVAGNMGSDPRTSPTQWALLSAKGDPSASFEISKVFSCASSITIAHGLGTLTPIIQGCVLSGATRWSASAVDPDHTAIRSTGPMNIVLAFLGGTPALPAAPAITQPPSSVTVDGAGTLNFAANASGSPTPGSQWQTDSGTAGATWSNLSGATACIYTGAASGKNGWEYRCVFTNASGSATTTAATATVSTADLSAGLLAYWPMNEGSGTTFLDAIAGNNMGLALASGSSGPGWAWNGNIPVFSGAEGSSGSSTTSIPLPLRNAASPYTFSAWFSLQNAGDGYLIGNTDGGEDGWSVMRLINGNLYILLRHGSDAQPLAAHVTAGLTANVRANLIASYDGSGTAAGLKLYVNGAALAMVIDNDSLSGAAISTSLPFTVMAEKPDISGNRAAGSMDHLRVYGRVISPTEIGLIQTGSN